MLEIIAFVVISGSVFLVAMFRGLHQVQLASVDASIIKSLPNRNHSANRTRMERFDHWFARTLALARIPLSPTQCIVLIVGLASAVLMVTLLLTDQLVLAIIMACLSIATCLLGLSLKFRRVVQQFEKQLPIALDLMARAVTAGESLDQAIELVAKSVEEPAKTEFVRCQNQLRMGLAMRPVMDGLVNRVDTTNVRIMASILSVHRETGGHLADTLTRLAAVIRNRFDYERKLRMVTSVGRASLVVVTGLAWCIFAYLFLFRPEYGNGLWTSSSGHTMLLVALVLELTGMTWGWALLRKSM